MRTVVIKLARIACVCALGWLGHSFTASAQSTFGAILGSVKDPSGAAVAGAKVKVVEINTSAARETVSDSMGNYEAPHLNPGRYDVVVEHAGFKRFARGGVVLSTAGRVRVDVQLEVGETSTQVTVTGDVAAIETETARISAIQNQTSYMNLPVGPIRSPFAHLILLPATQLTRNSVYSINGARGWSVGFSVDGTNTGNPIAGNQDSAQRPHSDLLQESRVDFANNSAEFAHAGNFNMTTRSGTNEFHGAANYQHLNSALAARSFFAATKSPRREHYYTTHIAGPLVIPRIYNGRNRTFVILGYDGFSMPGEALLLPNVPSLRLREGDFSRVLDARGNMVVVRDPVTGQPFPGNAIPAARLSPVALKYQQFFPSPNTGGPDSLSANYIGSYSINNGIENNMNGRIDHEFSTGNRGFVRFSRTVANYKRNASALPSMASYRRIRFNHSWTVADTHMFRPQLLHEFRLGGASRRWPIDANLNGKEAVELVGLTGYPGPLPADVTGFPAVSITGFTAISNVSVSRETGLNLDLHDHITWIRNRHSLKFGVNLMHTRQSIFASSPSAVFGSFSFTGFASGNAYADFLLGLPRTSSRADVVPPANGRSREYAVFAQDDWRISANLTLNLGLRYEYHLPLSERDSRLANFDAATGALVIPDESARHAIHPLYPANVRIVTAAQAGFPAERLLRADRNSLAPRIGFAYRLGGRTRAVLRGGFGVFYNNESRKVYSLLIGGPFVGSETYDNAITAGVPLYQWPQAFPSASARPLGVQNANGGAPGMRDSYTQQWNLTLEREIWLQTGLRVSYIGHQARQLPYRRNLNQPSASLTPFTAARRPFPQFNAITYAESGANQSYNSLQIEANRRFADGLTFHAHYTWAKNLTDSLDSNTLGNLIEDAYDRARERGNETSTARHRAIATAVYELPLGRGRRFWSSLPGPLEAVSGGWTLSGVYFWRTGYYFTPSFSGSDPSNTGQTGGRPDRIRDGNLPAEQRTLERWFDVTAFTVPPAGRFGNSGVNVLEGPGAHCFSAGISKSFPVYERLRFKLTAGIRNLFNHPTAFGFPAANISATGSVGRITGFEDLLEGNQYRLAYVGGRLEW